MVYKTRKNRTQMLYTSQKCIIYQNQSLAFAKMIANSLKVIKPTSNPLRCPYIFSVRCNIHISRLCYDVSVRLSVHDGSELAHYSHFMFQIPIQIYRALSSRGGVISTTTSRAMIATARPSCLYYRRRQHCAAMHDNADNTNRVLSVANPTDTDTESVRMAIPQLSHNTVCYRHPVNRN